MNKDIFGEAIKDFYYKRYKEDIVVQAPDFDDDMIPIPYLFRSYKEMPILEQKALDLAYGDVLDVGCGAGSHSLFLQNDRNLKVQAIDISNGAIEICRKRGVANAMVEDIFKLEARQYDTLLFLMNGSGIIGRLCDIDCFFYTFKDVTKA